MTQIGATAAATPPSARTPGGVRVWDRFVRFFHWSLVATVFIALMTEDDLLTLHVFAGYAVGGLLVARIAWGLAGPRMARFTSFLFPLPEVFGYLRDLAALRSRRYLGHSPAGGAMVFVLLAVLIAIVLTGFASYAAEEQAGPLVAWFGDAGQATRGLLATIHQVLANTLWLLILVHVAGVLWAGFAHGENLVKAMITGRKRGQ